MSVTSPYGSRHPSNAPFGTAGPWIARPSRTVGYSPEHPRAKMVPDADRIRSLADQLAATGEAVLAATALRVAAALDATVQRARAGRGPV